MSPIVTEMGPGGTMIVMKEAETGIGIAMTTETAGIAMTTEEVTTSCLLSNYSSTFDISKTLTSRLCSCRTD